MTSEICRNTKLEKLEDNDGYSRAQPKPQGDWRAILGSYPHAIVIRNAQVSRKAGRGGELRLNSLSSLEQFKLRICLIEKPNWGEVSQMLDGTDVSGSDPSQSRPPEGEGSCASAAPELVHLRRPKVNWCPALSAHMIKDDMSIIRLALAKFIVSIV